MGFVSRVIVAIALIVVNAAGFATAEEWDLFSTACDEPGGGYCDDLPPEFQLVSEQKKQSCFDPWLPRSCGHLPMMKQLVEGRDVILPPPLGIAYVMTALERHVSVTDIRVGIIGAMWQDTAQTIEVIIDVPALGELDVSVDQIEPDPWNFLVGTLWAIDERLHAIVELVADTSSLDSYFVFDSLFRTVCRSS